MIIFALDLGTNTGWAIRLEDGDVHSGTQSFKPGRYEGGGMRFLKFTRWLGEILAGDVAAKIDGKMGIHIYFEEVRGHKGTDAAHIYGGLLACLTQWCEDRSIPYMGVPVGTIKKFATGAGNSGKEAMIAAMKKLGYEPGDDNEADALAIMEWALETFRTKKPRKRVKR